MITYGFITSEGQEIEIGNSSHSEYAFRYVRSLEDKKDPNSAEWQKYRIFSYNVLGDCLHFVTAGLGWIKVGNYYDGHAMTITVPLTREDEETKSKKYTKNMTKWK